MIKLLVILLLFIIAGFTGCERMETMDATYPNYEAAMKATTVGVGKWIPEFLPPSAKNIHERHNIDTNEVWLFFNFDYLADIGNLRKSCKRVAPHNIVYPRYPGGWWPKTLYRHNEDTQISDRNYEYYHCEDDGIIAINSERGEVFYWHLG